MKEIQKNAKEKIKRNTGQEEHINSSETRNEDSFVSWECHGTYKRLPIFSILKHD